MKVNIFSRRQDVRRGVVGKSIPSKIMIPNFFLSSLVLLNLGAAGGHVFGHIGKMTLP